MAAPVKTFSTYLFPAALVVTTGLYLKMSKILYKPEQQEFKVSSVVLPNRVHSVWQPVSKN